MHVVNTGIYRPNLHYSVVQVTSNEIAAPQAFYVTWNSKRALSREAETLRDWLLSQSA